jgi:hypothetical protein
MSKNVISFLLLLLYGIGEQEGRTGPAWNGGRRRWENCEGG